MAHQWLPDRPVDEAASMAQLARGGIPLRAVRRIQELHWSEHPIFTSTLTPSESVVTRLTGLQPITQVMGSSMYHVGFLGMNQWNVGGELAMLTHAYETARGLALSRMAQEAALLKAHLVLDVKLHTRDPRWSDDLLEFTAVGTAVRLKGHAPPEMPALSLLEPDQLLKLHHAGYWPTGIAMGNCFWYEPHADCMSEGSWWSQELPIHTRAAMTSRHLAVQRFHAFAQRLGADGVVGVRVDRKSRDREYEINESSHTALHLDLVVMGTAVVRRDVVKAPPPRPRLVVDLRDLPSRYGDHGKVHTSVSVDKGEGEGVDMEMQGGWED